MSLRPSLAFNPRHRRLSTPSDAFQLHPAIALNGPSTLSLADHADVKPGDVIQCVHFVKRKAVVEKVATGGARVVERQPR